MEAGKVVALAYVTADEFQHLRRELEQMHKELMEVRYALIPEEKIGKEEHEELDAILAEMKAGKEKNWRDALKT